jgi:pyridoxal phosphate-dependent aminotransferase EpsN
MMIDPEKNQSTPEVVRLALESRNIEARPVWKPMHMQPVFAGARSMGGQVASRLFEQGLCLPSGTAMSDDDVDRISQIVRDALHTY